MYIKTRLTFQFTLIVFGILVFFSILVYYFSYTSQLNKFRENLEQRARNNAVLLINVSEVDSTLLKKIHQSTILLEEEEIALTDSSFYLLYSNNLNYLSDQVMKENSGKTYLVFFSINEKDGVCFKHHFNNKTYNVYILAFDKSRKENLSELMGILLWSILISVWLSILFAYLFSQKAMKPISSIIKSVKDINPAKLSNRLDEGNKKDEIAQLAMTFNHMLNDLEIAFKNQEDFVSNASHEMRTPLAVMIAESDYAISCEKSKEEYRNYLAELIIDLKRLNALLNSLLELANINRERNIKFSNVRIDEILFSVIHQVSNKYNGRRIIPKIQYPDSGNELVINGNEGLLTIAFRNILDNACKFSKDEVFVEFVIHFGYIRIRILDNGIGIPPDEIDSILKPFKRANNSRYIGGYGIGLSLVSKIMELHKARLNIYNREKEGVCVECIFLRVND